MKITKKEIKFAKENLTKEELMDCINSTLNIVKKIRIPMYKKDFENKIADFLMNSKNTSIKAQQNWATYRKVVDIMIKSLMKLHCVLWKCRAEDAQKFEKDGILPYVDEKLTPNLIKKQLYWQHSNNELFKNISDDEFFFLTQKELIKQTQPCFRKTVMLILGNSMRYEIQASLDDAEILHTKFINKIITEEELKNQINNIASALAQKLINPEDGRGIQTWVMKTISWKPEQYKPHCKWGQYIVLPLE